MLPGNRGRWQNGDLDIRIDILENPIMKYQQHEIKQISVLLYVFLEKKGKSSPECKTIQKQQVEKR